MERLNKVCRDTSTNILRAASPMTARWTLHNPVPKLAAKAVEISFFPMLVSLAFVAKLAVDNRKRIVGI